MPTHISARGLPRSASSRPSPKHEIRAVKGRAELTPDAAGAASQRDLQLDVLCVGELSCVALRFDVLLTMNRNLTGAILLSYMLTGYPGSIGAWGNTNMTMSEDLIQYMNGPGDPSVTDDEGLGQLLRMTRNYDTLGIEVLRGRQPAEVFVQSPSGDQELAAALMEGETAALAKQGVHVVSKGDGVEEEERRGRTMRRSSF